MPHCLQFHDCEFRVTGNAMHCQRCGLCPIKGLAEHSEKYRVGLAVATGGTLARRIVVERRPRLIIERWPANGTCPPASRTAIRSPSSASSTNDPTAPATGLGLAMLHASAVHVNINGFRRFSTLLDCASENGLKSGLLDLSAWLEVEGLLAPVSAESVEALREDPRRGFPPLVEEALGSVFPRVLEESFDGMSWESRADCGLGSLADMGGYVRITAALRIESSGELLQVRPRRVSTLEGSLGLLAGRLPLAAVPL